MIEFKAECGHTVRAKDEDAGGVVRCSYCGRMASVPDQRTDDLDFLFRDLEKSGPALPAQRKKRSRRFLFRRRTRAPGEFNPFPVILRLCYAAAIISIVIFVGRRYVLPAIKGESLRITRRDPNVDKPKDRFAEPTPELRRTPGLIAEFKPVGLYVASTPPASKVFYLPEEDAPADGRIFRANGVKMLVEGQPTPVRDGRYVVEVSLPIRDPSLKRYPGYVEFRRRLEEATPFERDRLLDQYFLADGAAVFAHESDGQLNVIRQYRGVEVLRGTARGIRALFLPHLPAQPDGLGAVQRLLQEGFLPAERHYLFDEDDVKSEFAFYQIPRGDWTALLEALGRVGAMPYRLPDGRVRLFEIDVHHGAFSARVIREAP